MTHAQNISILRHILVIALIFFDFEGYARDAVAGNVITKNLKNIAITNHKDITTATKEFQTEFKFCDINKALGLYNIVPMLIIGSGPAGLAASLYGVGGNVRTVVVHGPLPGGLLTQTTEVENWPGHALIMGEDIIEKLQNQIQGLADKYLKKQTMNLGIVDFLFDTITHIDVSSWPFKVSTDQGLTLNALSIVIATGSSHKKLHVVGENLPGVTYCAKCDAPFYKDKEVVIVGGGDSAAEDAMQLARHAQQVTILVRKNKLKASALMQMRLHEYANIKIMYNVEVQEVLGDVHEGVKAIKLIDHVENNSFVVSTDGVFVAIGHIPNSDLVKDFVKTDEHGNIELKGRSQTVVMKDEFAHVQGVFAAGDIADKLYKQAYSAGGYGVGAGIDAISFLTNIGFNPKMAHILEKNMFKV